MPRPSMSPTKVAIQSAWSRCGTCSMTSKLQTRGSAPSAGARRVEDVGQLSAAKPRARNSPKSPAAAAEVRGCGRSRPHGARCRR